MANRAAAIFCRPPSPAEYVVLVRAAERTHAGGRLQRQSQAAVDRRASDEPLATGAALPAPPAPAGDRSSPPHTAQHAVQHRRASHARVAGASVAFAAGPPARNGSFGPSATSAAFAAATRRESRDLDPAAVGAGGKHSALLQQACGTASHAHAALLQHRRRSSTLRQLPAQALVEEADDERYATVVAAAAAAEPAPDSAAGLAALRASLRTPPALRSEADVRRISAALLSSARLEEMLTASESRGAGPEEEEVSIPALARACTYHVACTGERIFAQGDEGDAFWMVLRGCVAVHVASLHGLPLPPSDVPLIALVTQPRGDDGRVHYDGGDVGVDDDGDDGDGERWSLPAPGIRDDDDDGVPDSAPALRALIGAAGTATGRRPSRGVHPSLHLSLIHI